MGVWKKSERESTLEKIMIPSTKEYGKAMYFNVCAREVLVIYGCHFYFFLKTYDFKGIVSPHTSSNFPSLPSLSLNIPFFLHNLFSSFEFKSLSLTKNYAHKKVHITMLIGLHYVCNHSLVKHV